MLEMQWCEKMLKSKNSFFLGLRRIYKRPEPIDSTCLTIRPVKLSSLEKVEYGKKEKTTTKPTKQTTLK